LEIETNLGSSWSQH